MITITAFESVTLDGVMQGLMRPDEDVRGGFAHGGWGDGFQDEVGMQIAQEGMDEGTAMLFGRRTYDDLLGYWTSTPEPNPFTEYLLSTPKYVVSRSDATRLTYPASRLLPGSAVETVAALRDELEGSVTILGSGELVRSLHEAALVDRYTLLVHPIVLGSGTRLFGTGSRADLDLVRVTATTTGVIVAEYVRS